MAISTRSCMRFWYGKKPARLLPTGRIQKRICLIDSAQVEAAAELIRAGQLVAFPTETVYGLGANALDPVAVDRIYEAKGRPATSPLIVHVGSIDMARQLVREWSATAGQLAQRFWPGPLTLVLPRGEQV